MEDDLQRELQMHLELEAEEQCADGVAVEDAPHTARRALGNATLVSEDVRESWGLAWLEHFLRDLRYGARSLRKSPGFTVVAVLTLALGIGANTAIFSAIDALVLRPLPFSDPDQLVRVYSIKNGATNTFANPDGPSALDVRDFAQRSHSFQNMVAYDTWRKNVSFGDFGSEAEQMRVGLVPAAYFEVLQVKPVMGRLFSTEENQEGKNFVAAISAQLWRNRFGADPSILGRQLRINGEPYTIVAVMPDVAPEWVEAGRLDSLEIWTPFAFSDAWAESARGDRGYLALGRMKPGVTVGQAQADLTVVAEELAAAHPVDQGVSVVLKKLGDTRAGSLRPMLFLLMGAVGLILLIACVNLANLLLVRNSARQRELALRAALGSARGGLIRQLLVETLLLSLVGSAAGLLLAKAALVSVKKMQVDPMPQLASVAIDWRVLAFTLAVSLATALLFGLAPALTGTRVNLVEALKQGGRSAMAGKTATRMRNILVATQMAMSLMLLVGASLLVQSMLRLEHQNLGIRQDHLLKGHLYIPPIRYPNPGAITRFCDQFADRVRALPGVVSATVTTIYPPNNGWVQMLGIPGRAVTRIQDIPMAQFGVADAHFRETLGIPLMRGRDFSEADTATSAPVALISQEFQRQFFVAQDPVGQQIHIGPPAFLRITPGTNISDASDVTIVGVIGDFRNVGLALPPVPQIMVLYTQHPFVNYGFKEIVIRTAVAPQQLAPAIGRQLHELDSEIPFAEVQTIEDLVAGETSSERFTAVLLSSFALAGLALAVIGIYGVVSFLVAQRRQELAVRVALGASGPNVFWLVVKQGLGMAAIGAAAGLCGAWATQKLTSKLLFGISVVDPATFAAGTLLLLAVAAIASAIPGARVLQIDPASTLRQD
jgi:putative ABC transport system permease protein